MGLNGMEGCQKDAHESRDREDWLASGGYLGEGGGRENEWERGKERKREEKGGKGREGQGRSKGDGMGQPSQPGAGGGEGRLTGG